MRCPCHLHDVGTWAGLGMNLERAAAFGSQLQCMGENFVGSRQQLRAYVIMGPAAFEGHRFSLPHAGGSAVKAGFHQRGCFFEGHPFSQPADLRGMHTQYRKDLDTCFTNHLRDPERFIKDFGIICTA